jgi:hypothetical protein
MYLNDCKCLQLGLVCSSDSFRQGMDQQTLEVILATVICSIFWTQAGQCVPWTALPNHGPPDFAIGVQGISAGLDLGCQRFQTSGTRPSGSSPAPAPADQGAPG